MTKEEVIKALAKEFGIRPDENGTYDLEAYAWQAGSYINGRWLSLATIVYTISE